MGYKNFDFIYFANNNKYDKPFAIKSKYKEF